MRVCDAGQSLTSPNLVVKPTCGLALMATLWLPRTTTDMVTLPDTLRYTYVMWPCYCDWCLNVWIEVCVCVCVCVSWGGCEMAIMVVVGVYVCTCEEVCVHRYFAHTLLVHAGRAHPQTTPTSARPTPPPRVSSRPKSSVYSGGLPK